MSFVQLTALSVFELEYIKVEWHMLATAGWQLTSETAGEI